MSRFVVSLIVLLFLSVPGLAQPAAGAQEYVGTVNHVLDDSTLRMDYKGGQIRVRLEGVAPVERPGFKQALEARVVGRQVRVEGIRWRDGYLLGRVYVDGERVGSGILVDH